MSEPIKSWGPESPFRISIPESQLELLRKKLELATWPDELKDSGWDYGTPLADMQRLAERWKNGYDWRRFEKELNEELPMYTRDIEIEKFGSINIHYVHVRSTVQRAVPLLFVHGWPGSFIEIGKIAKLLTNGMPHYPSFNVVAISLPGFGFSEAPKKKGFGLKQYAEICHKLMLSLGYNEYVTQGGDWGFLITREIASLFGGKHKHHKAWHTNFPLAPPPSLGTNPVNYISTALSSDTAEKAAADRTEWYHNISSGYFKVQSTKPQTIGYALNDSPVALLAWIYEKLVDWTDGYPWEDDEVLDWISIYWFSRSGPAASVRIYYEVTQGDGSVFTMVVPTTIPTGYSYFPKELVIQPKSWVRKVANVVFESQHDSGGHFAAYERPRELVDDLRKMFGKDGPAYGVVTGMGGYAAQ
ncbi:hypothetical protein AX16_003516 [Volvariella volvacea WC 439]|nr:hypothetical protein AX16_003516 [Volvariella volvacea WC 439]